MIRIVKKKNIYIFSRGPKNIGRAKFVCSVPRVQAKEICSARRDRAKLSFCHSFHLLSIPRGTLSLTLSLDHFVYLFLILSLEIGPTLPKRGAERGREGVGEREIWCSKEKQCGQRSWGDVTVKKTREKEREGRRSEKTREKEEMVMGLRERLGMDGVYLGNLEG